MASTSVALPPPKSCMLMYVCVCLYSGVLMYYVVAACRNVIELGVVEGWFVYENMHAVMWCGVNIFMYSR